MKRFSIRRNYLLFLLIVSFCSCLTLFINQYYNNIHQHKLLDNIYGGKYHVDISFSGPSGNTTLTLNSAGSRWPRLNKDGSVYVKENVPFIERKRASYDISYFALIKQSPGEGFYFKFIDSPPPDEIIVRRWPRTAQGTTGTLENGEIVSYFSTENDDGLRYYVSNLESQYIYSIFASWGEYYGEYPFLASTQASDQEWWELE